MAVKRYIHENGVARIIELTRAQEDAYRATLTPPPRPMENSWDDVLKRIAALEAAAKK